MTKKDLKVTTSTAELDKALKKNNWIFTVIYVFALCVVSAMLVFSYVSVFTSNFYPKTFGGNYMVGVVDVSNYYNAQKGQLLIVSNYKQSSDINVGDVVFFSGSATEGAGLVTDIKLQSGYITVKLPQETKNIQISNIIGKVINAKQGWGYILWFFTSSAGIITLNILLVVIVALKTSISFVLEPTKKGQQLLSELNNQRRLKNREKHIGKIYQQKNQPDYLNLLLDGNYVGNKARLIGFAQEKKDIPAAYKFMLKTFHRKYVVQEKLSNADRRQITNCIELMCSLDKFDINDEYMLADLILHCPLYNFDQASFCAACNSYLSGKHNVTDLQHFEYLLYLLIKQNPDLPLQPFIPVLDLLQQTILTLGDNQQAKTAQKLADYIKKLIKI